MIGGFDAFTVIMIAVFAVGSLLFLMGVCLFPSKNMDGKLLYFFFYIFLLNMDLFVNNFFPWWHFCTTNEQKLPTNAYQLGFSFYTVYYFCLYQHIFLYWNTSSSLFCMAKGSWCIAYRITDHPTDTFYIFSPERICHVWCMLVTSKKKYILEMYSTTSIH